MRYIYKVGPLLVINRGMGSLINGLILGQLGLFHLYKWSYFTLLITSYNCYLGPPWNFHYLLVQRGTLSPIIEVEWVTVYQRLFIHFPGFLGFDFHSYKRKSNDDILFFQFEKRWLFLRFTRRIHHQIETNVAGENQWKKWILLFSGDALRILQ